MLILNYRKFRDFYEPSGLDAEKNIWLLTCYLLIVGNISKSVSGKHWHKTGYAMQWLKIPDTQYGFGRRLTFLLV
jgi:hypothetical protein